MTLRTLFFYTRSSFVSRWVRPKHKALRIGRKTPRRFGYACTRTLTYSNIFRTTIIIGKIPGQPPEPIPFYAASQNAVIAAIHRAFRRQSVAFRASLLGVPCQSRFTGGLQMRDVSFVSSKQTHPLYQPPFRIYLRNMHLCTYFLSRRR